MIQWWLNYWHGNKSYANALLVWFAIGQGIVLLAFLVSGSPKLFGDDSRIFTLVLAAIYAPFAFGVTLRCLDNTAHKWLMLLGVLLQLCWLVLLGMVFFSTAVYTVSIAINIIAGERNDLLLMTIVLTILIWMIAFPIFCFLTRPSRKRKTVSPAKG